jgi:hypothetical protein
MRLGAKSLDIQHLAVKLPNIPRKKESEIDDDDRNRSKAARGEGHSFEGPRKMAKSAQ